MLYVTTRTDRDAFTPYCAMTHDVGPKGGQFLPIAAPFFAEAELQALAERSFHENVAHLLSQLHRRPLSGWDLDLSVGKHPLTVQHLNSRTIMAEVWQDPQRDFEGLTADIFRLLVKDPAEQPGPWFTLSLRIAMLFGVFGQLLAQGLVSAEEPLDVAVPSCDFQYPMAVWYAKQWGLPIGRIICCCNENNAPWSLLHQGELRTDTAVQHTMTPACDQAVPTGLERLIYGVLGPDAVTRYVGAVESGRLYEPEQEAVELLRRDFWVSVVSRRRMRFMIPNICPPEDRILNPYTVMSYAGLVDYRSRAGETGNALILSEESPIFHTGMLSEVLDIPEDDLRRWLGE